jgi:hypothetical protein
MPEIKDGSSIGASPASGVPPRGTGRIRAVTHNRVMKCFSITEGELHTLSSLNGACLFWVGLSTTMLGIGVGLVTSREFADPGAISPEAAVLSGPGAIFSFVLFLVFGVAAFLANSKAKSDTERIKTESNVET